MFTGSYAQLWVPLFSRVTNAVDGCVVCVAAGSATAVSGPKGQWIRAVIHRCLVQNACMGEDAVKEAGKQQCVAITVPWLASWLEHKVGGFWCDKVSSVARSIHFTWSILKFVFVACRLSRFFRRADAQMAPIIPFLPQRQPGRCSVESPNCHTCLPGQLGAPQHVVWGPSPLPSPL